MLRLVAWVLMAFALQSAARAADEKPSPQSVLLVASEELSDRRFRETVVLVTRHGGPQATVGLILNRPFEVTLDQVFPDFKRATDHTLYYGGPVSQGQVVFLVRDRVPPKSAIPAADELFISSDGGSLRRLLQGATPPARLRVFDGYAAWAPGQLEQEIDRGDWYLLPTDADTVFGTAPAELWKILLRRATQQMVRVPGRPGMLAYR